MKEEIKEKLQEFLENNKWQIVTIVIAIIVTLIFVLPTRHSDSDTFEISSILENHLILNKNQCIALVY